jgi:mRNA-degrading endonuclease HigB of HigAB toxin-antitoxin module
MIDTGITIKLYSFSELSEKAKRKAIEAHREFELSVMEPDDFISGIAEYDTPEELQKTYEAQYNYYLMNDEPIIENIEANDYLFFEDGELAHTITYCGKHPLAGETHLIFNGADYIIKKEKPLKPLRRL